VAELKPEQQRNSSREEPARELPGEIDSRLLLGRDGRILIRHKGQRYELRETRYGKLILTK